MCCSSVHLFGPSIFILLRVIYRLSQQNRSSAAQISGNELCKATWRSACGVAIDIYGNLHAIYNLYSALWVCLLFFFLVTTSECRICWTLWKTGLLLDDAHQMKLISEVFLVIKEICIIFVLYFLIIEADVLSNMCSKNTKPYFSLGKDKLYPRTGHECPDCSRCIHVDLPFL
jgi:hypothetical protein